MARPPRTIFRARALSRMAEERGEAVLPRFVRARVFPLLWLSLLGIGLAVFAASRMRVPLRVGGALVRDPDSRAWYALMPPDAGPRLAAGQPVRLALSPPLEGSVAAVESGLLDRSSVNERFGRELAASAGNAFAAVRLELSVADSARLEGSARVAGVRAFVQVGAPRLGELGPWGR